MELVSTRGVVVVPAFAQGFFDETHVPGAVRRGATVWVTGQTGSLPDGSIVQGAEAQLRQAFLNVGDCLAAAGARWADVVELTSYSLDLRAHGEAMVRVALEFLDPPLPAWTAVGVVELWDEGAVFELRCIAVVTEEAAR